MVSGRRKAGRVSHMSADTCASNHLIFVSHVLHLQCLTICPFCSIFLLQWNKRNEKGETSLHRACIDGNLKQVQYLVEQVRKARLLIFVVKYCLFENACTKAKPWVKSFVKCKSPTFFKLK